jgi:hypothetical protein
MRYLVGLVFLVSFAARADGTGNFGLSNPGDAIVAALAGCRDGVLKTQPNTEPRLMLLYCSCMTDAIRVANPGTFGTTNLVIPIAKAPICMRDARARVTRGGQQPKGYFGIERHDIPTENLYGGWHSCVQAGGTSRQCGCVMDAFRVNVHYPFRNDLTENERAGPTPAQLQVCERL